MDNVVVIPTCHRPEMLALCLRRLSEAPGCPEVRIYADTSANINLVKEARDKYFPAAEVFHQPPHMSVPSGCWNILNSIKKGAELAENVFLVEEDVMVYPSFFEWHLAQGHPVTCGRKDWRFYPGWPDYYTNPGSRLTRPVLDQLVPHINDDFYANLRVYMDRFFPPRPWSSLDDGLIRRVVDSMGIKCRFADPAVCAHQGFHAYNQFTPYLNREKTLDAKVKRLELILDSANDKDRYTRDFEYYRP
jgi:hypothetical protein